jgi:hypothetical protein
MAVFLRKHNVIVYMTQVVFDTCPRIRLSLWQTHTDEQTEENCQKCQNTYKDRTVQTDDHSTSADFSSSNLQASTLSVKRVNSEVATTDYLYLLT